MGESRYVQLKQQQAIAFIEKHKAQFVWTSLRRALYMWTNFWSFNLAYLREEPFDIPAIFLNATLTLLALWGLWTGWRAFGASAVPYAITLFCFPIVYYISHPGDYYRRPADPFFVILAVYAVTVWLQRRSPEMQTQSGFRFAAGHIKGVIHRDCVEKRSGDKVKSPSLHHRFVIALHSPVRISRNRTSWQPVRERRCECA